MINDDCISTQADKIRAEFEMYRDVKEPAIAEALIRKTQQRIEAVDHPDPYICKCFCIYFGLLM